MSLTDDNLNKIKDLCVTGERHFYLSEVEELVSRLEAAEEFILFIESTVKSLIFKREKMAEVYISKFSHWREAAGK